MGVSRTVIRETLRQLESEGLVAMIPNKGPVVRDLTVAEATDLYSIRAVLEGLAARLFVDHAARTPRSPGSNAGARSSPRAAYRNGDPERILDAKNRFYDVLFEGAGSETLSSMIGTLHGRIRAGGRSASVIRGDRPRRSVESIRNLRALVAAIRKRDADLAERDHAGRGDTGRLGSHAAARRPGPGRFPATRHPRSA